MKFINSLDYIFYEENLTYDTLLKYMLFSLPKDKRLKLPEYLEVYEYYDMNVFHYSDLVPYI